MTRDDRPRALDPDGVVHLSMSNLPVDAATPGRTLCMADTTLRRLRPTDRVPARHRWCHVCLREWCDDRVLGSVAVKR